MAKKAKRTTMRSSTGKKLYAVRTATGKFKDIQTYERAHRADLAKTSKPEKKAQRKAVRKATAKKATAKKATAKKATAKKTTPKKTTPKK